MSIDCQLCGKPISDGAEALRQSSRYVTVGSQDDGQHIRIVSTGTDFSTVCALLIQPDGTEIPITDTIKSMTLTANDQEFNSATITFERVEWDVVGSNRGTDTPTARPPKREAVA